MDVCVLFCFSSVCLHVCAYAFKSIHSLMVTRHKQRRVRWLRTLTLQLTCARHGAGGRPRPQRVLLAPEQSADSHYLQRSCNQRSEFALDARHTWHNALAATVCMTVPRVIHKQSPCACLPLLLVLVCTNIPTHTYLLLFAQECYHNQRTHIRLHVSEVACVLQHVYGQACLHCMRAAIVWHAQCCAFTCMHRTPCWDCADDNTLTTPPPTPLLSVSSVQRSPPPIYQADARWEGASPLLLRPIPGTSTSDTASLLSRQSLVLVSRIHPLRLCQGELLCATCAALHRSVTLGTVLELKVLACATICH